MKNVTPNTITQNDVILGDALFSLYCFERAEGIVEKASHIPILHDHPFFEVMLCAETVYDVILEEEAFSLSAHTAFFVPMGLAHCAGRTENIFPISFGVALQKTKGSFSFYNSVSDRIRQCEGKAFSISPETEMLFNDWYRCDGETPESLCMRQVYTVRFLYSFLKDISAFGEEKAVSSSAERKMGVDALLNTMLDDRRYSLKEIADALGYTRKHTLRLIHRRYGCDFRTLKKRKALEAAKLYLASSQRMTVKDIATALGYESESAFYAFFKHETGLSPMKYRKEQLILPRRYSEYE